MYEIGGRQCQYSINIIEIKTSFPLFKTIVIAIVAGIIGALIVLGIGKR